MSEHRVLDARRLGETRPLASVVDAVAVLAPGDTLKLLLDADPSYLFPILDRSGYSHSVEPGDDHDYEVVIWPRDA